MAKNHYSYEKRQQELKKKKKRQEKLDRKHNKNKQKEDELLESTDGYADTEGGEEAGAETPEEGSSSVSEE